MIRLFFTPLNIILAALLLAATIAGFILVPAGMLLPVHWGLDGQVDNLQPKEFALLTGPGIALIVGLVMAAIRRWGNKGRADAAVHVLRAAFTALLLLALGIESGIVLIGIGYPVSMVQIVCVCIGVLMILLGNAMPKSQPNSFAGIRILSTLRDPANWQATHRLTGVLMIVGGVVLGVAGLVMPASLALFLVIAAAILLPLIAGTIYSLSLARRSNATER